MDHFLVFRFSDCPNKTDGYFKEYFPENRVIHIWYTISPAESNMASASTGVQPQVSGTTCGVLFSHRQDGTVGASVFGDWSHF
jgi:hypothetical protein